MPHSTQTGTQPALLERIALPEELAYEQPGEGLPSAWSISSAKRLWETILASIALILVTPFVLAASVFVLTSRGPLLFASIRVGKKGKLIRVLKFRTMWHQKHLGIQLTRGEDERITPPGRWLRKWKLDELPQLINVLRGEMSLVGPRPDSPEFIETLPENVQSTLFLIRPGITSVASVKFRDEQSLLAHVPENELRSYYIRSLLPHKISIDLDYASRATFCSDLRLLLRTALTILW